MICGSTALHSRISVNIGVTRGSRVLCTWERQQKQFRLPVLLSHPMFCVSQYLRKKHSISVKLLFGAYSCVLCWLVAQYTMDRFRVNLGGGNSKATSYTESNVYL